MLPNSSGTLHGDELLDKNCRCRRCHIDTLQHKKQAIDIYEPSTCLSRKLSNICCVGPPNLWVNSTRMNEMSAYSTSERTDHCCVYCKEKQRRNINYNVHCPAFSWLMPHNVDSSIVYLFLDRTGMWSHYRVHCSKKCSQSQHNTHPRKP